MKIILKAFALSVLLTACGTVTPVIVRGHSVAMSGNVRNAGILEMRYDANGNFLGYVVSEFFMAGYRERVKAAGALVTPRPVLSANEGVYPLGNVGDNGENLYLMDGEHMEASGIMAILMRQPRVR